MSKICCVGDADVCPKSSSCSMVLRSACSHRHSRESSTVKEYSRESSARKSKSISPVSKKASINGSLHLESLESSLKHLALKSAENSILTECFYNSFELSERASQKFAETSSLNVSCVKELHFSQLSASKNSSIKENINRKICSSDYSSATESDMNENSLDYTSNMSRSRRFTRSSMPSVRSLSCSEDEDDISVKSIVRPRIYNNENSSLGLSRKSIFLEQEASSQNLTNNHASCNERLNTRYGDGSDSDSLSHFSESSHTSRLTVQNSLFHRFRWLLWRCTYLKIIKMVNFDVWILSRLHNYGKHKAIFFLLLPLLLFLFWHIISYNPSPLEALSETSNSVISSVFYLSSALSSFFVQSFYFVQKCSETIYTGWLVKTEESASLKTERDYDMKTTFHPTEKIESIQPSKDEIKILQDEINSLKMFLKSSMERTEANRLENESKLQNEIKSLQLEFQSVTNIVRALENEIKKQSENHRKKTDDISLLTNKYESQVNHLKVKLSAIEENLSNLEVLKKQWNEKELLAFLEKHLILVFKNVADSDPKSKYHFFNEWLNSKFFSHEKKLMQLIDAALKKETRCSDKEMNYDNVIRVVESTVIKYVDSIKRNLSELNKSSYSTQMDGLHMDMFSEDRIKQIVKEAIMMYDADKIGQVDYALESGGGSVLGTRCSETYVEKYGKLSIFGVPLWTNSNSPRTAIQPDVQPGRCWAFKGSQGFLVIELSATIYPTGFTLEHIPVSLSPSGSIDSAPKNFSVWGLDSEKDSKGNLLGEYSYDISGEPLQYFAVQKPSEKPYSYIELQIHSNHGNMEYTCLYRFRVHGKRIR